MPTWINQLYRLAEQLPTGGADPRALEKLHAEQRELAEETDPAERALEAADCCYYAAKAVENGLLSVVDAEQELHRVAQVTGLAPETVIAVALAKYRLRARPGNPKDRAAETAAAQRILQR